MVFLFQHFWLELKTSLNLQDSGNHETINI